jgi:hypothetical protein
VRGSKAIDVNGATHYLFLDSHTKEVASAMRGFLDGLFVASIVLNVR